MNIFDAVLEFWKAGLPKEIPNEPTIPPSKVWKRAYNHIREELKELDRGIVNKDVVEISDAVIDLIYVVVGFGVIHGIPMKECFEEVHRTNMAKFPGGKAIYREDGKILKPEGWEPPDLATIIEHARKNKTQDQENG